MDKAKGIEAIIYLQSMAGITETQEQASKGWDAMSKYEKAATLRIYDMFLRQAGTLAQTTN